MASNRVTSITDVGCGDFRVGAKIVPFVGKYHGLDVVPELIAHNQTKFASRSISFSCLDATVQRAPPADLCLIRQVLQHLSNHEIMAVLHNCGHFQHVIVTEHWPSAEEMTIGSPNLDMMHGCDTRHSQGSWVQLDAAPFSWKVESVLCDIDISDGSRIRTVHVKPGSTLA